MNIYDQMAEAGVPLAHHESDLYAKVTPVSKAIVLGYEHRSNVTRFNASDGTGIWFDMPFAYQPFWDKVEARSKKQKG